MSDLEKALKTISYTSYIIPIILVFVAIPLALNRVEPNSTYGFRTQKTFKSAEAWYSVNSLGGICFILAGLASLALIFVLQNLWAGNQLVKLIISFCIPLILLVPAILVPLKFG